MGRPGLARIRLRERRGRVSGLAWPWRATALAVALETEPESIPDLLLAATIDPIGTLRNPVRRLPA